MRTSNTGTLLLAGLAMLLAGSCHSDLEVATGGAGAQGGAGEVAASAGDPASRAGNPAVSVSPAGFASHPDRGQAIAFPANRTTRVEGAHTWHRVDVSEAHALAAIAGGTLRVATPSGALLDFAYESHVEHPSGDWTWVGSLAAAPQGTQAILTFGSDAVFGTIGQADDAPLRLTTRDGVAWMVSSDRGRLGASPGRDPDFLTVPDGAVAPPVKNAPSMSSSLPSVSGQAAEPSTTTTVDIVVGYTSGYSTYMGGASATLTRLHSLVDIANQAYINSLMPVRLRMVHAMQVNYPDATANKATLEALTGYVIGTGDTTPDPAFAALRQARETYGADLVTLVRRFKEPEHGSCGIAWLIGAEQQTITTGWEGFGYSVVSDGAEVGGDGLTYFCADETLVHELAHNMGSAHDPETAKGDDGVLDAEDYGAYPYSFGYKTTMGGGFFHTIMAYADEETGYRVFSNPRITFCGGLACGTANADNARSLTQTAPTIAQFRATVVPEGDGGPHNDVDADGNSDLLWFKWGSLDLWYLSGYTIDATEAYSPANGLYPYLTGEFDGAVGADIAWRESDGTLVFWLGGASYNRSPTEYAMSLGWRLQASGDHDADGISDLYWRSAVDGRVMYWLMDEDQQRVDYRAFAQLPEFELVTVGDFNGDSATDLFFRRRSDGATVLWSALGTGFSTSNPGGISKYWTPVNSGDYDDDGDDDLVWRSQIDGRVLVWVMEDGARVDLVVFASDMSRELLASSDFNGDGRLDLVWRRNDGAVTVWLNTGSGFTQRYVGSRDLSWKLVAGTR